MSRTRWLRLMPWPLLLVGFALSACASSSSAATINSHADKLIYAPRPATGPYVVVAVDNHFHDIHPEERNLISQDRQFIVKNEGYNLHNFTVVGTGISIDIEPNQEFVWPRIGDYLKPGSYTVICTYHAYAGMIGKFIVTP